MGKTPAELASKAMAELYVWSAIQEILEGGTSPRSPQGQRTARRVIATCQRESQRLLREYDKHIEAQP
jgi:hypothetical protein